MGDSSIVVRPDIGTAGQRSRCAVNYFNARLNKPDAKIYHYAITIAPTPRKTALTLKLYSLVILFFSESLLESSKLWISEVYCLGKLLQI